MKRANPAADRRIAGLIEGWFAANIRPMPWRLTPRDPYLSLVSEFMLQQTQVARVLEKFGPFIARFPDVRSLAGAPESEVLAQWSGLGYYRRARLLHTAARAIVERHGGRVPGEVKLLRGLPGIGRYTAGAIASVVFGRAEPLVDGNVARVLLRVDGRDGAADEPVTVRWTWERAAALVGASSYPGRFNEGLMELGATVCTPRGARCVECPLRTLCVARRRGLVDVIPRPKRAPKRTVVHCAVLVDRDDRGRVRVEQRSAGGMWASMWQAPTLERAGPPPTRSQIREWVGADSIVLVERFDHQTSHRLVRFTVWEGRAGAGKGRAWPRRSAAQIRRLAVSNPQRRILLGTRGP